jgi:hypothetical protein
VDDAALSNRDVVHIASRGLWIWSNGETRFEAAHTLLKVPLLGYRALRDRFQARLDLREVLGHLQHHGRHWSGFALSHDASSSVCGGAPSGRPICAL